MVIVPLPSSDTPVFNFSDHQVAEDTQDEVFVGDQQHPEERTEIPNGPVTGTFAAPGTTAGQPETLGTGEQNQESARQLNRRQVQIMAIGNNDALLIFAEFPRWRNR